MKTLERTFRLADALSTADALHGELSALQADLMHHRSTHVRDAALAAHMASYTALRFVCEMRKAIAMWDVQS